MTEIDIGALLEEVAIIKEQRLGLLTKLTEIWICLDEVLQKQDPLAMNDIYQEACELLDLYRSFDMILQKGGDIDTWYEQHRSHMKSFHETMTSYETERDLMLGKLKEMDKSLRFMNHRVQSLHCRVFAPPIVLPIPVQPLSEEKEEPVEPIKKKKGRGRPRKNDLGKSKTEVEKFQEELV